RSDGAFHGIVGALAGFLDRGRGRLVGLGRVLAVVIILVVVGRLRAGAASIRVGARVVVRLVILRLARGAGLGLLLGAALGPLVALLDFLGAEQVGLLAVENAEDALERGGVVGTLAIRHVPRHAQAGLEG